MFQDWNSSRSIQENMCVSAWGQGSLPEAGTRKTDKKQLLGDEGTIWWEDCGGQDKLVETMLLLAERLQSGHRMLKTFLVQGGEVERMINHWTATKRADCGVTQFSFCSQHYSLSSAWHGHMGSHSPALVSWPCECMISKSKQWDLGVRQFQCWT